MTANQWLTLETAAEAVSVPVETLQSHLSDPAPEKKFQPYGLLFDRTRWKNKDPQFLQLLSSSPPQATTPLNSERTYRWENTPIRLEVTWLPLDSDTQERQILIWATSYDDFPVCNLLTESELGKLPRSLNQLLEQLEADLPVRKIRHQQKQAKPKKSTSPTPSRPASQPTTPQSSTLPTQPKQPTAKDTQISFF